MSDKPLSRDPLVTLDIEHATLEQLIDELGKRCHGAVVILNEQPQGVVGVAECMQIYTRCGFYQAVGLVEGARKRMARINK